jgi:hypothetical protein
VAMGDLRSLLTSYANSAYAVDYRVGTGGLRQQAAPVGSVRPVRYAYLSYPSWHGTGGLGVPGPVCTHYRSAHDNRLHRVLAIRNVQLRQAADHRYATPIVNDLNPNLILATG